MRLSLRHLRRWVRMVERWVCVQLAWSFRQIVVKWLGLLRGVAMPSDSALEFSPFRLDLLNQQLWRGAELLLLRPKPFAVLAYLATRAGRLVLRAELVKAVWPDTHVGAVVLRGYIRDLRLTLGDDPEAPRFIETVAHRGYRFIAAVSGGQYSPANDQPSEPAAGAELLNPTLVGREAELNQLLRWLTRSVRGHRQVVFVTGEPGIGKTTLVDAFLTQAAGGASLRIARGQCVEHFGVGEVYLPVLEALGQLCRQPGGEEVIALLSRHAPTWLVQMPALIGDQELETVQRRAQGATRERMLRELAEALEVLTAATPLVLVIEDLQWSDFSTLDMISLLARRRGRARLFAARDLSARGRNRKSPSHESDQAGTPGARGVRGAGVRMSDCRGGQQVSGVQVCGASGTRRAGAVDSPNHGRKPVIHGQCGGLLGESGLAGRNRRQLASDQQHRWPYGRA